MGQLRQYSGQAWSAEGAARSPFPGVVRNIAHLDAAGDAGGGEELVITVESGGAHHVRRCQAVPVLEVRHHPAVKGVQEM